MAAVDLSREQIETFRLAGDGMTHKEIAARLNIHPNTVKQRLGVVKTRLGLERKRDLVPAAREYFNGSSEKSS